MRAARAGRDAARRASIVLRLPCRGPVRRRRGRARSSPRGGARHRGGRGRDLPAHAAAAHGAGVAELTPSADHVSCRAPARRPARPTAAVQRCRRLLDLDADPQAVAERSAPIAILGALVAKMPGLRLPGHRRRLRARDARRARAAGLGRRPRGRWPPARRLHGAPLATPDGGLTHLFPQAEAIVELAPGSTRDARPRRRAVLDRARDAVSSDEVVVDAGADRAATTAGLLDIRGVGPWTAAYIAMRGLGDPDVFLPTDLGVRNALERMDLPTSAKDVAEPRSAGARGAPTPSCTFGGRCDEDRKHRDDGDAMRSVHDRDGRRRRHRERLDDEHRRPHGDGVFVAPPDDDHRATTELGEMTDAVVRYFAGDLLAIDHIAVRQHSGPFIEHAWDVLRAVPAGSPITYAELAAKVGRPDAVRAAANACAFNAAALFVPCHRIVRTGTGSVRASSGRLPLGAAGEAPAARPRGRNRNSHESLTRFSANSQKSPPCWGREPHGALGASRPSSPTTRTTSASLLDAALRHFGFDVVLAANGREALGAVADDKPDLIVLDVMLPDLDGFEVCRRLRADGRAGAGAVPHGSRRHRGQGARAHARRRRLRHEAVQPRRGRGAGPRDPAPCER